MLKPSGASAYSSPTYDYGKKEFVSCEKAFGKGWKLVGNFHSHPRYSGSNPSSDDNALEGLGRNFLGTVDTNYQITTKEYP